MEFQKILNEYLEKKSRDRSEMVTEIEQALKKSGYESFVAFLADNGRFVLLNKAKDVSEGVVLKDGKIVDFKNTKDFDTVTVDAYARYNILKRVSDGNDLEKLKKLFSKKRTWVIHCVEKDGVFEAHTHGLDSYAHPDFRIKKNIGKGEIAYLFNSLCKSIQRGNAFRSGDTIENLYDNCNIVLTKADDGLFDVDIVARSAIHQ